MNLKEKNWLTRRKQRESVATRMPSSAQVYKRNRRGIPDSSIKTPPLFPKFPAFSPKLNRFTPVPPSFVIGYHSPRWLLEWDAVGSQNAAPPQIGGSLLASFVANLKTASFPPRKFEPPYVSRPSASQEMVRIWVCRPNRPVSHMKLSRPKYLIIMSHSAFSSSG